MKIVYKPKAFKLVYTKHAQNKFKFHKQLGKIFHKKDIRNAIQNPYFSEINEERGVKIVLKRWDKEHDLRVIYKEKDDIIIIITFYPTEKERYAT